MPSKWTQSVRELVATLPASFTLADIYAKEAVLQAAHPENQNVRPKIRQQLQVLRDKSELTNPKPGTWQKVLPGT